MTGIDDLQEALEMRAGVEALERLKKYLTFCAQSPEKQSMLDGLNWSLEAIEFEIERIKKRGRTR